MSDEQIDLKPCPFCGGMVLLPTEFSIFCNRCGAEGPDADNADATERRAAWNRRARESAVLTSASNASGDLTERSLGSGAAASARTELHELRRKVCELPVGHRSPYADDWIGLCSVLDLIDARLAAAPEPSLGAAAPLSNVSEPSDKEPPAPSIEGGAKP